MPLAMIFGWWLFVVKSSGEARRAAPFAELAYKRPLDEDDPLARHVQFDT